MLEYYELFILQGNLMATEQNNSQQWIETYVIRYTIGTILGAAIIYILCTRHANLAPLLLGLDVTKIENSHMFLLLAYGLCFCYIASGPVLILHAGRFYPRLINKDVPKIKNLNSGILFGGPIVFMLAYMWISYPSFSILSFFELSLASLMIWGQYFVVAHIFLYKDYFYDFYQKLSVARAKNENQELVNSYRKLKDHGNAFMILFCEIALGVLLDWTNGFEEMYIFSNLMLLILWIVPSAAIWIGATNIEYSLVYPKEEEDKKKISKSTK